MVIFYFGSISILTVRLFYILHFNSIITTFMTSLTVILTLLNLAVLLYDL